MCLLLCDSYQLVLGFGIWILPGTCQQRTGIHGKNIRFSASAVTCLIFLFDTIVGAKVFLYLQVAHIPGALFFDLDGIVDQTTDVRNVSGYTLHPHFFLLFQLKQINNKDFLRWSWFIQLCKSHVLKVRFCHQLETDSFNQFRNIVVIQSLFSFPKA